MLHHNQARTAQDHDIVAGAIRTTRSGNRSLARKAFGAGLAATVSYAMLLVMPSQSWAVGPVATKATCGPKDRRETGLQGQTSLADQFAPGPKRAFNCNLQLVGQATGEGANHGFAITDKCAYYSQWPAPELPQALKNPGTVVVDVSDSANPKIVRYLQTPGMMWGNESPIVHLGRKLLVAQNTDQTKQFGKTTDIYDVSDCLNPVLKFSGVIPGFIFHSGDFSPDGMILWGSPGWVESPYVEKDRNVWSALDVSDPSNPKVLYRFNLEDPILSRFHGISVSDDGNTAYFTTGGLYEMERGTGAVFPPHGVGIADVSEVQARKPNAKIKMLGEPLRWNETQYFQFLRPMTIKGRKYLWANDFGGAIPFTNSPTGRTLGPNASRVWKNPPTPEQGCRSNPGLPGWGYVHILDVEDPARPVRVSGLRNEVHEPKNCLAIANDPYFNDGYGPLDCDVDNYQDAYMMVCSFGSGGVRVFDIRDVKRPREIAYYKPPAVLDAPRPASMFQTFRDIPGIIKVHTSDEGLYPRFAKGGKEIWFTSFDNGFQVVRFSDEFMAREKSLFGRDITCNGKLRGPRGCP